jgi:hypothetical protein
MRTPMLHVFTLGCICASIVACGGGNGSSDSAADAIGVFGQVKAEDGTAISGAQVCFVSNGNCITTDASGKFKKAYDNTVAEPIIVQFFKPGYARKVVRMRNSVNSQAGVVLRQIDTLTTVALPAAGASAVVVEALHDDSRSALVIGPDSLVDASGALAVGNANVSLTYFHPLQSLETAPGALNAEDGNGIKGLFTFGMADIEIEQNGALLQVAPGQLLGWDILEPPTVAQTLSPNGPVSLPLPDLYSLNPNTGLWHLEGTAASGFVSYDANSTTVMTKLAHLTSWNVDGDASAAYGGCVSGRIIDPCGNPIANKAITVWYLGFEQLKDWTGTVTGSDGTFCTETYLSSYNVSGNRLNINYFVAGADSYTDTTMCNPAPAACFTCVDESVLGATLGWCTNCDLDPSQTQPASYDSEAPTYYTNTCNAPSIDLVPYSSCSAGGCTALGDITLNDSACSKTVGTSTTTTTPSTDPCVSGTGKGLGEPCQQSDVCCPRMLSCLDFLCVPPKDGTATSRTSASGN